MYRPSHSGLSPSSLALYIGCGRKYFLKKIAKVAIDPDQSADTVALNVGKAFHKVLEDTQHNLDGITYKQVHHTVAEFIDAEEYGPMIFGMLAAYKKMHAAAGLEVVACEVELETPEFFGIVDVVLKDPRTGDWWIGDMKTAAAYSAALLPTLPRHPQLNLYAHHAPMLAEKFGMPLDKYAGCRYRLVTKSKMVRKKDEELPALLGRLGKVLKAYDFIVPKALMDSSIIYAIHEQVAKFVSTQTEEHRYPPNYGNCTQYFRPCEFWSKCHGKLHSEMKNLSCVESE